MSLSFLSEPVTEDTAAENVAKVEKEDEEEDDDDDEEEILPGSTLFIKNLNFSTTEETLREVRSDSNKLSI